RNDFQVKIRGFRIELGEIESKLAALDGVKEAVVLAREDETGDNRLIAYYTGSDELTAETLRTQQSRELPDYMVPAAYVRLEALPLTPNGKLDRKALPAPEGDGYSTRAYEAPLGEIEKALAHIWAEILKVERIGRHDNFFDLGGHSLLAVTLISRIRTRLGVEVLVAEIFTRPALSELANHIETAAKSDLPAITAADRTQALPLSFAQQRLWFLTQLDDKAGQAYHLPGGVKLTGVVDKPALKAALDRIVWRHEVLRTTFSETDGVPVQVVAPADSGFMHLEHDLTGRPQGEVEQLIEEEARQPFDLATGPLIRGRLIRRSETEHILLMTMHHIVSDGWSMGVLINEVGALYQAFSKGQSDPLPPLAIQYADYAVWQRKWLEGEVLQRQLSYWVNQLSGAPALLELPTDHPRPAEQDYSGASIGFHLDAELTKGLKALSRRHGVTLFMTLLAGWAALLSRLSGQEDIVIGTPFANRTRSEIEPLIGFFVNTLAMRIDLSASPTVVELLERVKQLTLEGQRHQDIPFEQVVDAVNPVRSLSHSPLFQVMFAWQNNPEGRLELGDLQLEGIDAPHSTTPFDLSLSMQEAGDIIVGSLEYAAALFEQSTLERYLGHWRSLLKEMAADETRTVDELKILSDIERRQLLYDWNTTETEYPKDKCMHELFEEQAQKTPEAVAVVYEDKNLTYQ
ncbi:MAG TPA: condensation domain-containing protein, partial [Gammaproteobacteria bacterium]|nr:condensation domain-containing protein [Gammaproteobacteria bacterium]